MTRLALANPVHAPYGCGGVTLLEHYGLVTRTHEVAWEEMRESLPAYFGASPLAEGKRSFSFVYGENISQAAPLESHLRLEQEVVILRGRDRP